MGKTGIVKDNRYLDHDPGPWHPESQHRLEAVYEMLTESDMQGLFQEVPVRRVEMEELNRIHLPDYVEKVAATAGKGPVRLDPDTATSSGSYEAALLAAGGLCEAIAMVAEGRLDNAFALVRPPGHHAEAGMGMGFCLFNNIAIGARYAQDHLNINRILIADWDLHHGNGTQHSFEQDPSVLYFSTHQYPYYPGTGSYNDVGIQQGEGFTVNVPLSTGYGDHEYAAIFEKLLKPIAMAFNPELILVSAGFDTYQKDPLGGMNVTSQGYGALTRTLINIADACCGGKLVFTLEGGYDLDGLASSVKAVLKELAGLHHTDCAAMAAQADRPALELALKPVFQTHACYWEGLQQSCISGI